MDGSLYFPHIVSTASGHQKRKAACLSTQLNCNLLNKKDWQWEIQLLFSFHVLELITELELSLLNISISPLPSQICHNRIKTNSAASHYRAVCRALVAEVGDLKLFLQKISDGETEQMRLSVDAQASKQELDQLFLNDWVSKSQRGSGHKNLQTEGEFVNWWLWIKGRVCKQSISDCSLFDTHYDDWLITLTRHDAMKDVCGSWIVFAIKSFIDKW